MTPMDLHKLLDQLRLQSRSEFEKGEYFERLVKVYLENDDFQGQYYDNVWHYRDWAMKSGRPTRDIGVANCNHNWFGLQTARFFDRINCDYRRGQNRINCE